MAMTLVRVPELLKEATDTDAFNEDTRTAAFPLAVGAGAVDPELIKPNDQPTDIEEVIAFRCSSL